jgi:putative ATP-dependent endonuclease of OLD family
LLENFLEAGEEAAFLEHVRRISKPHRVITAVNTEISTALGSLSGGVRPQAASLGFTSETLLDVARDLRFMLADAGLDLQEIRSSGLGYANLLYMATVIVELTKARDADLTLFLVEEPEAHLHPQLQMLVLEFLLERAQKSFQHAPPPGQPEGRIQVIVTTHSPNLTAWVSPKHLVVVRSQLEGACTPPTRKTAAISVQELGLPKLALEKIGRYLDVTRSALLFGNRAMLVEGIAESLLIPVCAKHIVLKGKQEAWLRFRGAVVVPIDGVDFKPYVEILLRPKGGARIADLVVVVTDADPTVPGNRKADLEKLASDFGSGGNLKVLTNEWTLEHAMFAAGNERLLKDAFLALHPNSEADWSEKIESAREADRASAFVELICRKRTRKGDLAQEIAACIATGLPFAVPKYLRDAIEAIATP